MATSGLATSSCASAIRRFSPPLRWPQGLSTSRTPSLSRKPSASWPRSQPPRCWIVSSRAACSSSSAASWSPAERRSLTAACRAVASLHAVSASATTVRGVAVGSSTGSCGRYRMLSPRRTLTLPPSGVSAPASSLASVDLPVPLAPMRPTFSPRTRVNVASWRTTCGPKAFRRCWAVRAGMRGARGYGTRSSRRPVTGNNRPHTGYVMSRDLYDERPYTEHAYAETHPARIAAVARMARWDAPPVSGARILELGCGRGGNLLTMAAGLPQATLVGVDGSTRQIDAARCIARETGLSNVTFVHARFEEMEIAEGSFDYVICHGVLSWIPERARGGLLSRIAGALRTGGVACVSFNVLPGWYERLAARDWLRYSASTPGLSSQPAPVSLRWLGEQMSPEHADARRRLQAVAGRLDETSPEYAVHED